MQESCNSTAPHLGLTPLHALFLANDFRSKKSGPDQRTPMIFRAIFESERNRSPSKSKVIVHHRHTMRDSVPFSNQDGSRLQPSSGWPSQWTPFRPIPAPALERAASGTFEAADCFFPQSVPEHLDQQVATNPARSIRSEQVAPGLVQLFSAEV
jgi:hypothetical protein